MKRRRQMEEEITTQAAASEMQGAAVKMEEGHVHQQLCIHVQECVETAMSGQMVSAVGCH
jgi:hypothetical protein